MPQGFETSTMIPGSGSGNQTGVIIMTPSGGVLWGQKCLNASREPAELDASSSRGRAGACGSSLSGNGRSIVSRRDIRGTTVCASGFTSGLSGAKPGLPQQDCGSRRPTELHSTMSICAAGDIRSAGLCASGFTYRPAAAISSVMPPPASAATRPTEIRSTMSITTAA
jgi:hypothetical protein